MRNFTLRTPSFNLLAGGFENWLRVLGYAQTTVYGSPSLLKAFFYFLEERGITGVDQVNGQVMKDYLEYLQKRKNSKRGGGLSVNYILSNLTTLRRFSRYLQETHGISLEVPLRVKHEKHPQRVILTREEILRLYQSTDNTPLGYRDRAMLGVYYGLGLRRSEGIALDVKDVLLKKNLVYVRKGKNYRERYVPLSDAVRADFENYIFYARDRLTSRPERKNNPALLVSEKGKRISGNTLIIRLQQLAEKAGIGKPVGLHTLRHSIATHLLSAGMSLEGISRFLGHSSLESTQIYTHLSTEMK
jgi:integrase/recombinase XerD